MLWTIELFSIFTAGWKLKRKKRKQDATLISETVQISTVWLKGLCIMGVTLAFTYLKKFGPCVFHCSISGSIRKLWCEEYQFCCSGAVSCVNVNCHPLLFFLFTMITLKHLDIILANPLVHEKKGNLFKCSTENRFVLMTRGTT